MGGGASSGFSCVSNLGQSEPPSASLLPRSTSHEQNSKLAAATMNASWGHGQAASCAVLARHPSLHNNRDQNNLSLGEETRQAETVRSSCPRDLGRSPASRGQSSYPASSGVVERELLSQQLSQLRIEVASLRECVDHLVWLLESNHKEDLRNFQELRESIGRDQLSTKGEDNRVDFLQHKQQQLEQKQKQQQEEQGTTKQGELDNLPKKKRQ